MRVPRATSNNDVGAAFWSRHDLELDVTALLQCSVAFARNVREVLLNAGVR